jgi:pterin-4a-carbinolamine dehydratase
VLPQAVPPATRFVISIAATCSGAMRLRLRKHHPALEVKYNRAGTDVAGSSAFL